MTTLTRLFLASLFALLFARFTGLREGPAVTAVLKANTQGIAWALPPPPPPGILFVVDSTGDGENVGIIRSPLRAIDLIDQIFLAQVLPDILRCI